MMNILSVASWKENINSGTKFGMLKLSKSKAVLVHARKAYRGSRGIAPVILNLSAGWRWVVKFMLHPLYPQDRTVVPIEQEAGRASEPVCTVLENCLCVAASHVSPDIDILVTSEQCNFSYWSPFFEPRWRAS